MRYEFHAPRWVWDRDRMIHDCMNRAVGFVEPQLGDILEVHHDKAGSLFLKVTERFHKHGNMIISLEAINPDPDIKFKRGDKVTCCVTGDEGVIMRNGLLRKAVVLFPSRKWWKRRRVLRTQLILDKRK